MNALATTFADLTVALTPRPLEVRIVTTSHTKKGRFYTVFVGHGSDGEYYEVNEHVLGRLRAGRTPDDLCLEPFDPDTFNAEEHMKPALTLEAFADWCEKQPKRKGYRYDDAFGCAFCQFLRQSGMPTAVVSSHYWKADGESEELPDGVDDAVYEAPWTFGALATRLRTALSEAVQP